MMGINIISRNLFVRCGSVFLRDGGVEQTALNIATDRPITTPVAPTESLSSDPLLKQVLLAPVPLEEMGPYEHPWRVSP